MTPEKCAAKKFNKIPPYTPGKEVPGDLYNQDILIARLDTAKRALMAAYHPEVEEDPKQSMTDALTDFKHLADYLDLNFYEMLDTAQNHYLAERHDHQKQKKRGKLADKAFEEHKFEKPVTASNGWESVDPDYDTWERIVFLENGKKTSIKTRFIVQFNDDDSIASASENPPL
jgi:hypothetical protein